MKNRYYDNFEKPFNLAEKFFNLLKNETHSSGFLMLVSNASTETEYPPE